MTWNDALVGQIEWHWQNQLRPRLDGLTDDEYRWEPVPGAWNIRRRTSDEQPGSGEWTVDWAYPEPDPAPVTTIAWRLAHLNCGVLGLRIGMHFGGDVPDYQTYHYEGSAGEALSRLDEHYARWVRGVRSWSDDELLMPVGSAEPGWEGSSRATLVLHINRELIHHGAEICLLRDLYAHGPAQALNHSRN